MDIATLIEANLAYHRLRPGSGQDGFVFPPQASAHERAEAMDMLLAFYGRPSNPEHVVPPMRD